MRWIAGVLLLAAPAWAQDGAASAPASDASAPDAPSDDIVPPIEDVRDPPPPPAAVIDDDEGEAATPNLDEIEVGSDAGSDDGVVPPLDEVRNPRRPNQALVLPTLPPVTARPSWSVAGGLELASGLGSTLIVEARPVADLWLMASGGGTLVQEGGELLTSAGAIGPPLNQTLTDQFTLGLTGGVGARYGFRFGDRVELSPLAWVRGSVGRGVTFTSTRFLGADTEPTETEVATLFLAGSASLGASAEVFLLDELSLRIQAEAIEGVMRVERSDFGTPGGATVSEDDSIGFVLLPRAGFFLRILF